MGLPHYYFFDNSSSCVLKKHTPQSQPIFNIVSWFAVVRSLGFIYNMQALCWVNQSLDKVVFLFNWLTSVFWKILDYHVESWSMKWIMCTDSQELLKDGTYITCNMECWFCLGWWKENEYSAKRIIWAWCSDFKVVIWWWWDVNWDLNLDGRGKRLLS